ncbi:hypothetical protein Tco_1271491 [Tanacetum coccineum]
MCVNLPCSCVWLSSETRVLWKLSCLLEAARQSLTCIRLCLRGQSCLHAPSTVRGSDVWTSYSLSLAETGYSLPPEETSCSLPLEGTSYSLPLEESSCSLPLKETSYSLPLEGTSYSLVIASGSEVAFVTPAIPVSSGVGLDLARRFGSSSSGALEVSSSGGFGLARSEVSSSGGFGLARSEDTELETLVSTYDIPLDLRPRLPDPNFRMINLSAGDTAIVPLSLSKVITFELLCRSLNIEPTVTLFRVFQTLSKQGDWFSFAKRGDPAPVCMEVVKSGLKLWKEKFFLIDHSYRTGFGERYGDGLANPTNVKKYRYERLNDAVKRIDKAKHVPKVGELNPLVNKLILPLTLITVMVCEGSRFHPTSYLFQTLMKKKIDEPLPEVLYWMFLTWNHMTKVLTHYLSSTPAALPREVH